MQEFEWKAILETILGSTVIDKHPVHRGYTPVRRDIITLGNGTTAFVKTAVDEDTARWIRQEVHAYHHLHSPHVPRLLGYETKGEFPMLVLEDLSHAHWPPTWEEGQVSLVLDAMRDLASQPFEGLQKAEESRAFLGQCWDYIAEDPAPFLSLGLVSEKWLEESLPILLAEQEKAFQKMSGESLLHFDLRSDNLCIHEGRAIIIDWNCACIGNPELDIACWLPSLAAEGGPAPEDILPGWVAGGILIAGYFASQAGLPDIPHAPKVRFVQKFQLREALPWVQRMLSLPPLDG